ncbi:hypothetical protein Cgig2_020705 [Carnegiea gigantea]|uniref:DUF4283 domain-containing protein n=1 Tax=Carnegiea gigantea TaxID=171969 RepID=A0A9Q1JGR4_9CARY|nr:hypothetical protein Cgig2_020705 [Carnegiea gigantea]
MALTAGEEEIVEFEKKFDEEKADQIALSHIRKLYTTNTFDIEGMKSTFKNVWKPTKELVTKELDQNLFIFHFPSKADKEAVLNEGPCTLDDRTLLLKELDGLEKYLVSDIVRFRVKVYNVPRLKQTKAFAECLANLMGKFVSMDVDNLVGIDKSLNFIVDINITKPMRRGIKVKAYGRLGHIYHSYELFNKEIPEEKLLYGPNLRASPIRRKKRGGAGKLRNNRRNCSCKRSRIIGKARRQR